MADLDGGVVIGGFDNSYRRLPGRFFEVVAPVGVKAPKVIRVNFELGDELGLGLRGVDEGILAQVFSGNLAPVGAEPLAQAYAGHQFGGFSPVLGDGRANLMGEVVTKEGKRFDIQLKGSGPTAFSRRGDGRAALGPVLREYIISEALHALGIPGTRALAAVVTGEQVMREGVVPGAVFTRVAESHVRVGTFQYFAARGDLEGLKVLADYVIARHYPQVAGSEMPYLGLLEKVVERQAKLIAHWMGVGFIHGVMNTDNMAVSGQSIDFGPCAFMDEFDGAKVFSSIDYYGRYAYGNQPAVAKWNLARFAETLLPVMGVEEDEAVEMGTKVVNGFEGVYEAAWVGEMRGKMGFATEDEGDAALGRGFLDLMQAVGADFTNTWRALCGVGAGGDDGVLRAMLGGGEGVDAWLGAWRERGGREDVSDAERGTRMRGKNPVVIARNHRVEQAIGAAVGGDFGLFERLVEVLKRPFEEVEEYAAYRAPPAAGERVLQTFCGT